MKRCLLSILLFFSINSFAETIYVTDKLRIDLRSGKGNGYKIVKMVPSGTPLTVVERDPDSGYILVRLNNGMEGYILSRYTSRAPAAQWRLDQVNKEFELLKAENAKLLEELTILKTNHGEVSSNNTSLIEERDQLSRELNELRITAANAIQLKQQRDQLNERVVNIERENQQLKREKQTLEDSANQDWFLYGGILAFTGILFGLLIPKISWRRKTSHWDTF